MLSPLRRLPAFLGYPTDCGRFGNDARHSTQHDIMLSNQTEPVPTGGINRQL